MLLFIKGRIQSLICYLANLPNSHVVFRNVGNANLNTKKGLLSLAPVAPLFLELFGQKGLIVSVFVYTH